MSLPGCPRERKCSSNSTRHFPLTPRVHPRAIGLSVMNEAQTPSLAGGSPSTRGLRYLWNLQGSSQKFKPWVWRRDRRSNEGEESAWYYHHHEQNRDSQRDKVKSTHPSKALRLDRRSR